ncbi:hypothetical protein BGW38_003523 [Lunasporangiospora selenospora]|uniref:J domain-containing protein n=1 Tax=Lunasporangiospora selenospora TaxID=979761 RepID=A0A9P6FSJ7_9FUNG|nr:hypothetical protein BGW38_003523 [Lunasporangiospora selenospora]
MVGWMVVPGLATRLVQGIFYAVKYSTRNRHSSKSTPPITSPAKASKKSQALSNRGLSTPDITTPAIISPSTMIAAPMAGTARFARDRNRIYCLVILAYLVYTLVGSYTALDKSYYDVLDLPFHRFSQKQLKTNFRRASLLYHPDKVGQAGADMFVGIREAHDVLADPVKRFAYDRFGPTAFSKCSNCVTANDHLRNGVKLTLMYYTLAAMGLIVLGILGNGDGGGAQKTVANGRYWRFVFLFGLLALELNMILSPSPSLLEAVRLPSLSSLISLISTATSDFASSSAFYHLGPVLVQMMLSRSFGPSSGSTETTTMLVPFLPPAVTVQSALARLEELTNIANRESSERMDGLVDVFRGDKKYMEQLQRLMERMGLDSRLIQDQQYRQTKLSIIKRVCERGQV